MNPAKPSFFVLSRLFLILSALGWIAALPSGLSAQEPEPPVPVIFDTDMSGDCDDGAALAVLHSFINQGKATLLACVTNVRDADASSAATVHAINTYYGRPDIPIGTFQGKLYPSKSNYTLAVRKKFAPDFPKDDELPKAVEVYRKALAGAPDGTVKIISVGLTVNLRDLLDSKPDTASPLDGAELIRKKVRELVIMAGCFPSTGQYGIKGGEFNASGFDTAKTTAEVMERWPTRILFTGGEIGWTIQTGPGLKATPDSNPVKLMYGFSYFGDAPAIEKGRSSWDQTAVWLAIRGPEDLWDVVEGGAFHIEPDGADEWRKEPAQNQAYIKAKRAPAEVAKLIETEMAAPPLK